jgi:hypothetical protein
MEASGWTRCATRCTSPSSWIPGTAPAAAAGLHDGHDRELLTEDAVLDTVRRSASSFMRSVESDPFLDRLTQAAGGRAWSATSDRQLRELFARALDEMRARYLLTYTPRGVDTAGWHSVKVSLKNVRGDITARPGYSR